LETGRTYCGGGFNLQNLPREKGADSVTNTIRGCFVPEPGKVFIDCDYSQIELVVLGYAIAHQFGLPSQLAQLINNDNDVHRLIAAAVLGKSPAEVIKTERDSAKPVSFGRPGGMGVNGLRRVAKASYGIDLTDEQVAQRIQAYHQLCPELDQFLKDEIDVGTVLASKLGLTPARYYQTLGRWHDSTDRTKHLPAGWLGGMLLKVLRDETPTTKQGLGQPYTPEEIDFFWDVAQQIPLKLKPNVQAKWKKRQPDKQLWEAVRNWAGRRPVFTVTGRLRANATFCSSRNTIFQGTAADGAILGLWRVWRAGYRIVDFVHDQLVVESPADDQVKARAAEIESLMKEGMAAVIPGMLVKVETVLTRSPNKKDLDPDYCQPPGKKGPQPLPFALGAGDRSPFQTVGV
jgi:DNA polymerase I